MGLITQKSYCRYWGKTRRNASSETGHHLLVYHCLDVAATGHVLLSRTPAFVEWVAIELGLSRPTVCSLATFLLSIHDIGKFAEGFQNLCPDLFERLHGDRSTAPYTVRHDSAGYALWRFRLKDAVLGCLGDVPEDEAYELTESLERWVGAVTGHHGQPPRTHDGMRQIDPRRLFRDADQAAATEYLRDTYSLFLSPAQAREIVSSRRLKEHISRLSWWIAGHTVLSDWLGSNERYFEYVEEPMPLAEYWQRAVECAAKIVADTGVVPVEAAQPFALATLIPKIDAPTPAQQAASSVSLTSEPHLFVIEDVTGSGKTEAAMLLANRIMAAGAADGFYVALPTMATANAMYDRMRSFYRYLFASGSQPSLVLAHGNKSQHPGFSESVLPAHGTVVSTYDGTESTSEALCSSWIADSNKKALLAHAGIGTIDQALMGILPARHQSLRLLGLFRKVLVVDEVHACDTYMLTLLKCLLGFHASAGGSAILLSATLPHRMRRDLVEAFQAGAGNDAIEIVSHEYPLFTHVAGQVTETHVAARSDVSRQVRVRFLDDPGHVSDEVLRLARTGACVCLIRNTVADAIDAYDHISTSLGPECVTLFHARFTMHDRLAIEADVLNAFGPDSTGKRRTGRVVVATQVLEQSLDLDFDWMITDLAPIDLIIQRAGRLRRHARTAAGDRTASPDQRPGDAELVILSPEVGSTPDANWYSAFFPRGAFVYPDHGRLWLTAHALAERGGFRVPEDARDLIELVYDEDHADRVPDALQDATRKAYGEARADGSLAQLNMLDLDDGYQLRGFDWWEDTYTPTRLGEPTIPVYIGRWDGGRLDPWAKNTRNPWAMSQLRIRRSVVSRLAKTEPPLLDAIDAANERISGKGKWSILLPMEQTEKDGIWRVEALNERGHAINIVYDALRGFRTGRTQEPSSNGGTIDEPD